MTLPTIINNFDEKIQNLPDVVKNLTVEEIEQKAKPTKQLKLLRRRYNEKIVECAHTGKNLTLTDVCSGIVHTKYFYGLIKDPYKLAYITSPIQAIEDEMKVLETEFLKGLHEIADAGPFAEGMRMGDFLKAAEMVLSRTSPTVQRIDQRTMSVKKTVHEMDDSKLDEKLQKLVENISDTRKLIEIKEEENEDK